MIMRHFQQHYATKHCAAVDMILQGMNFAILQQRRERERESKIERGETESLIR